MANSKDYYEILGVEKTATQDEIKAQYRKLVKQYHPDLHPNDEAVAAKFKEINENDLFYYEKQVSEMKEIPNRKNEEQITITNTIVKIPAIIEINYIDRETQKPIIEPTPPEREVPPITTAAMASNS